METEVLEGYGLRVHSITLTQVVRQLSESGILYNATLLRQLIVNNDVWAFPQLHLQGFTDVVRITGDELLESLEQSYSSGGTDETIVVTRSNARAYAFNQGIRGRILWYDEEVTSGEKIMVVKNNYHWVKPQKTEEPDPTQMDFIANGDIATVRRFRHERSEHGFRFADVTLTFPDYEDMEVDATIILDTLASEAPALTRQQQESLFQHVWDDYPELRNKRDRMKAVKEDPYFNALQVKYAYAVTCHKAQGGQWKHVYVDQGPMSEELLTPDYFRWLYTALTRATERVYLVNWPLQQIDGDIE